ncbi:MAG: PilZ domain-containing protein [Hyphomicrobiaceae bacterium]|nr:PilZ domain-containing protein [Hyphomicrobiaceae bacterium]
MLRRRVLKSGVIAFNNRHSTLPCTIKDISETGARLIVNGSINAPDTFELIVELDGLEAQCRVVRRTANEVRVNFVGEVVRRERKRIQVVAAVGPKKSVSLRRQLRASETR